MSANLKMSTNLIKTDELARLMWSIGDRYHDWWPASRGVIENYKNCGVWGMVPVLVHYGIVCDSVIAFKKKYDRIMQTQPHINADTAQPHINADTALNAAAFNKDFAMLRLLNFKKGNKAATKAAADAAAIAEENAKALAADPKFQILNNFFKTVYTRQERSRFENLINTSINQSIIDYTEMKVNGSEEKGEWTDGNLAQSAEYTLGYFGGVSTIEEAILNRFTQGIPYIFMNVTQIRNNLDIMIANYREICEQLFGDLTHVKWFAVLCDADIGPFCKLFDDILQKNAAAAATPAAAAAALTLNPIIQYCNTKNIPVMYMIKTPQTITDSSNNQSFRPCLTLYRFPITHTRIGANFEEKKDDDKPAVQPYPDRNQPGIPADPAIFYNNYKFDSKLDSLAEKYTVSYHAGVPAAGSNPAMLYTFDEGIGGSSFIYRIEGPPSAVPNAADAAAAPAVLRFDIPYGSLQGYRASGPSLGDLMLHYIHKNLKDFDSSTQKGFSDDSSSIFSNDINYLHQGTVNPSIVFKHGMYNLAEYIEDDNGKNEKAIKSVSIYNKLNDIRRVVDSSLGIRPPKGEGDTKEDSYKAMPANSLCNILNYDQVPAVIMTVIKLLGDYDQAVAARVLNKTTEFYNRIVFCSIDRSCVAHSANNGVRTIQNMKKNDIIVYNGTPVAAAPAPAAAAAPAASAPKKQKKGGGFKNTLDDCDNQCLDIKQTMLTAGMNASRYLLLYKKYIKPININDQRHSDVLLDIYNEIRHKYIMYNRDLQNDITDFNVKYDNNNMRVFMGILNDLYYNSINKNKSLKMLIALCNIHNRNYMLPEIDYMKYVKNTNSLSQQLRKKSTSYKKSAQSHKKSSSHLREKILYQLRKKLSQSRKKSSQSRKKSSQSHKKSSQSRKKSAQSHEKILYQPRKKSSLPQMAPIAGGF